MKVWLQRISHHAEISYPLIEEGILTIGFSDFSVPEFVEGSLNQGWPYFEKAFDEAWGNLPRTRYNLWKFLVEMSVGDWVVVPSWGTFSVFTIDSEAKILSEICDPKSGHPTNQKLFDQIKRIEEERPDLGFFRTVTPLAVNIPRYEYADAALTSRMKIRSTTADISDIAESVRNAVSSFKSNTPINFHADLISSASNKLLDLILTKLNPDKFERLLKWYFSRVGATEVSIPAKNEREKRGDADIVAIFDQLRTIIYVQAKHHNGETSSWALDQILEYSTNKNRLEDGYTTSAWVVSTAERFSEECVTRARENGILLIAGPEIAKMIIEAGALNLEGAI